MVYFASVFCQATACIFFALVVGFCCSCMSAERIEF